MKNNDFDSKIKNYFTSSNSFLFSKGRASLYATLKALGLTQGDEVIIPGYTCLVVPTAAQILGIKPVYVDIDPQTYNLSPQKLESCYTENTKALIVQHTYGIPCDMDPIMEWADSKGIPIIEDCCLAFGSKYNDCLCGTFGIAAYFSGQWNKPFSTGLGGMLVVNDDDLAVKVEQLVDKEMIQPGMIHRLRIWLQMQLYEWLVTPRTTQAITTIYRTLSKMGLVVGSSTKSEYSGVPPKNYFMGMTPAQAKKGAREMEKIEENISHRKQIAAFYQEELPKIGFQPVELNGRYDPVYVRYPVRVANKKEVLEAAYRERVEIGSWFESPLHPEGTDLQRFHYTHGCCPESERAAREVVNLPTHRKISMKEAERVVKFLYQTGKPC